MNEDVWASIAQGAATITLRTVSGKDFTSRSRNKEGQPYELPRFMQNRLRTKSYRDTTRRSSSGDTGGSGGQGQFIATRSPPGPQFASTYFQYPPMMPPPPFQYPAPPMPPGYNPQGTAMPMDGAGHRMAAGPTRGMRSDSPRTEPCPLGGKGEGNNNGRVSPIPAGLPEGTAEAMLKAATGQVSQKF